MKTQILKLTSMALGLVASAAISHAATINLIGNDGLGTSSFNSGQNWASGGAPSATNDYTTSSYQMRTPGDAITAYTFGGASLTLADHGLAGAGNGSILEKFTSGAGSVRTLTINNLTNAAGGLLRSGGTAGALIHVAGNHFTIAANSSIWADQCIWVIDAPLFGGDGVILTNFANNANDHVAYTANNSGFTGSWYLTGAGTSAWSLELDAANCLPGNPSTFNAGQITFLGGGQLRDTVGCSINNPNGGITLAANGIINAATITVIGEPITDLTNGVHSVSMLTSTGTGTLVLSNANNNYAGGTTISAGVLQLGVDNAIPGNTIAGDVTDNATLDLNGHSATINGLNGSGVVDNMSGGTATLTIGANGASGTFSGTIQNSSGTLSLTKIGAGTETLSGGFTYSGTTLVAGGTLSLAISGSVPSSPGSLIVSNGAVLSVNVSSGTPLPANNLVVGPSSTLSLTLGTANGINAAGSLTFQDNATNNFNYGTLTANPTAPAINATGGISAPGSSIFIGVTALGLKPGTFTLIKYTGTPLANMANFHLNLPLGVVATLVNNTGNHSIDINIATVPDNVAWNGANGGNWDLTTVNWTNLAGGGLIAFRQGDGVLFDDTLFNDFVHPQPTNINLTATFSVYPNPGLIVNSTLPYSFAGVGGITGPAPLVKSNTGSLTLLTSNSFTGGVFINDSGSLIITKDSALGASSGAITLNGGTLQINGGVTNTRPISMPTTSTIGVGAGATASLGGVISAAGSILNKSDNGTLILTARENITSNVFLHGGTTIIDSGGSVTNTAWDDVGQGGTDSATLTLRGTGSLSTTSDFNVGDLDSSAGVLNISNSATLTANALFIGSANAAGSTASGIVNQAGGTLNQISTAVGAFSIGGRTSASGVGVYNMIGGTVNAGAGIRVGGTGIGTLNQSGGLINARQGINIARITGSLGTNNLNGGALSTFNVSSSTGTNAVFNFNGGTLQANFSPGSPWFSGGILAYVQAGGAFIDSSNNNVTISTPLLAGSPSGGLTKLGTGTLTLTGVNTFTGPLVNGAGTLVLNSASTYAGGLTVGGGTVQMTTASSIQGSTLINSNATFAINQVGSATASLGGLNFGGSGPSLPGATLALAPSVANNPALPLVNCGTLTLNGNNTISLPIQSIGTIALFKYSGAIIGGGTLTNLLLPQGAAGFLSNNAANSTWYAVITNSGPGITWTGTNSVAGKANLWDINTTTNWLLGAIPTSYHQIVVPGDLVTFNDLGSGTVILTSSVAPASLLISNNSKNYTFSGSGNISGPTSLQKLGSGTAVINLTNNSYSGNSVISNGTLQVGSTSALPPSGALVIGPSGTLELAGLNLTAAELTGSGVLDNNAGLDVLLNIGTSSGGTWNGSIQDQGHGGVALTKNGTGTWVVGGNNKLGNGSPFTTTNIFAAGTTIITNGGSIISPRLQTCIAFGGTATLVVAGGTLAVSNDVLAVGISAGANGMLIVNSGTVVHGGGTGGSFGGANQLIVGAAGATGTLIVNGGQVLNSQALWLGQNASGSGTLYLNGGLVQATAVQPNNAPTTSIAYFNGGTLQATTTNADFLQVQSMIMSNGLVLDDGGFPVTISSVALQPGDAFGGGLTKQGAGTLYLDSGNLYTGTTRVNSGTLAGVGSVAGPVVVAPGGTIGAGDEAGIGTFNLSSMPLTIQGTAALRISKNGGVRVSDLITGISAANYGGTLSVINVTDDSTPIVVGDTFTLFSAASHSGNFSAVLGSPGSGLSYSFNPANGVVSVVAGPPTAPTNISYSVSGSTLTLSWPASYVGWVAESNAVSIVSTSSWVAIPGSQSVTSLNIPINKAQPQIYFRLRHP